MRKARRMVMALISTEVEEEINMERKETKAMVKSKMFQPSLK